MAAEETTLTVAPREIEGSRSTRRLRRSGLVPGIVYGGDADPVPFQVDARELRNALARGGAVIQLDVAGTRTPVVLKDQQRHPVTGTTLHVDLVRVNLSERISATVVLDLVGAENAPGVREGGVLEQVTRELTVEALPNAIPDTIQHDVSGLEAGATVELSAIVAPEGVTLVDDPTTVVATVTAPMSSAEPADEIETETEVASDRAAGGEGSSEG